MFKGYRFYCPSYSTRIVESRNAKFLENDMISGRDRFRDLIPIHDHIETQPSTPYDRLVIVHITRHVTPPDPKRMWEGGGGGVRNCTGTLYLLFQTLVGPSRTKCHIQRYKYKTTTVVVFIVSIHTVLSPINIYIYKNCTFTFTSSERETYR